METIPSGSHSGASAGVILTIPDIWVQCMPAPLTDLATDRPTRLPFPQEVSSSSTGLPEAILFVVLLDLSEHPPLPGQSEFNPWRSFV